MDYEKMGTFYLGKDVDVKTMEMTEQPLLYDSKDLTTHAVCVGMTGSGKTGLCLSLLEEAAIDGIPAIAIDPKGDIGNLLLTFPELAPSDFKPWVDPQEADRQGQSQDEYAATVATTWRDGLAKWGQSGDRIKKLRATADFKIYTPGSESGLQLSILNSFHAPSEATINDADALRELITSTVSGLLALLGIDADPVNSREHILLSTLLNKAWKANQNLDLTELIRLVTKPEIETIGAFGLEDFYPAKDRMGFAMTMNNLLASPSFAAWTQGEPLSIKNLLWTKDGKPKISIISIAHLNDAERMFFVTLLLGELTSWMRSQSGTTSLRALLYMDEIFGFLPPTANPPSKNPMLLLLKQARAFGVGLVLATQNPVDLDYKALSNAGTWFLGRLQTEQDVDRVITGLQGAASQAGKSIKAAETSKLLAGLKSRMFLMNNVHDDGPTLFNTRWAMSYLRGPLTRSHIKILMADDRKEPSPMVKTESTNESQTQTATPKSKTSDKSGTRPIVEETVNEWFIDQSDGATAPHYRPYLIGSAELHYVNAKADIDAYINQTYYRPANKIVGRSIWAEATPFTGDTEWDDSPVDDAAFDVLDKKATKLKSFGSWEKSIKSHLYKECPLTIYECAALKLLSNDDESKADFSIRVREHAREKRDEALEKLRTKYAPKVTRLQDRLVTAEQQLEKKQEKLGQHKYNAALSAGATVLGALFGRKLASRGNVGRAATTMRGVGRVGTQKGEIERAQEKVDDVKQKLLDLQEELEEKLEDANEFDSLENFEITEKIVRLRKADTVLNRLGILWIAK